MVCLIDDIKDTPTFVSNLDICYVDMFGYDITTTAFIIGEHFALANDNTAKQNRNSGIIEQEIDEFFT